MAGSIVRVIPPRLLDFGALQVGQSLSIVLKRDIDVSQWISASLLVRINNVDVTGGSIDIQAQKWFPSEEDPALEFVTDIGTKTTINAGSVAPSVQTVGLGRALGGALRIVAVGTRTTGGNISVNAGVDINLTDYMEIA